MFAQQVGLKISQRKIKVMMPNVPNPSVVKVKEKILQQPKNLPTSVALLGMTVEQAVTSGIASTWPGTPSEC